MLIKNKLITGVWMSINNTHTAETSYSVFWLQHACDIPNHKSECGLWQHPSKTPSNLPWALSWANSTMLMLRPLVQSPWTQDYCNDARMHTSHLSTSMFISIPTYHYHAHIRIQQPQRSQPTAQARAWRHSPRLTAPRWGRLCTRPGRQPAAKASS